LTKPQMSKSDKGERAAREAARRHQAAEAAANNRRKAVNGYRHTLTKIDADLTREIRFQQAQGRVAVRQVDRAVMQMRKNGCSWVQIAAALNTTKQGAMKRHAAALLRDAK
jgi:hypothetical protein